MASPNFTTTTTTTPPTKTNKPQLPRPPGPLPPSAYAHSPAHYAVYLSSPSLLQSLLSTLPSLTHPSLLLTPSDCTRDASAAATVAAALDRRDVPGSDTPLHLAVRSNNYSLAAALATAGADVTLQNSTGWTPLQEALCLGRKKIASVLLRHHRVNAWSKLRRRSPALSAALRQVNDFYLEVDFHFESSIIPLLSKAAPSDTYKIWKRGADVRADTSLAGFDGLRLKRADHSFLFFGEGNSDVEADVSIPPGSLLVLRRGKREVYDAFATAAAAGGDAVGDGGGEDVAYRPGLNITAARLVPRTTWLRKEKVESVGEWKARVFDMHNVVFSFRSLRAMAGGNGNADAEMLGIGVDEDGDGDGDEFAPLEIREDDEDGFLVADIPPPPRRSCHVGRRSSVSSSNGNAGGKRRNSVDMLRRVGSVREGESKGVKGDDVEWKEEEMVRRNLRPTVWLTEDFPLTVEEFLPLLDILANKVRAVRRLRELLTTKFPPGTFPVKVAIPVVPTVRVVITFTKFVPLQQQEEFFTPVSSPTHLSCPSPSSSSSSSLISGLGKEHLKAEVNRSSFLKWNNSTGNGSVARSKSANLSQVADNVDPFTIPNDYTWIGSGSKNQEKRTSKSKKIKKGTEGSLKRAK